MTGKQLKKLQDKLTVAQTDLYYTKQAKFDPPRLKKEKLQEAEEEVAFYEEVLKMTGFCVDGYQNTSPEVKLEAFLKTMHFPEDKEKVVRND